MLIAIAALAYGIASGKWLSGRENSSGAPNPPLTAEEGPVSEPDVSLPQDEGTANAEGGEDKVANSTADAGTGADGAEDGNGITPPPSAGEEAEPVEEPVRIAFVGDILLAASSRS